MLTCALPNQQSKLACFAAAYIFFTFWSTHLSRVLYGLVFVPVSLWVSRKQVSPAGFCLLWAATSVLGAGLYTANGEAYLFTVSQRAFKRHPMSNPDQDLLPTIVNTFFIKFGSSIMLHQLLHQLKPKSLPKKLEAACLLFTVALYIPCSYLMSTDVASQQTFIVYFRAHILVPFIVSLHRWAVDAVSGLLHSAPMEEVASSEMGESKDEASVSIDSSVAGLETDQRQREIPSSRSSVLRCRIAPPA